MIRKLYGMKRWGYAALIILVGVGLTLPLLHVRAGVSLDYELLGTHPEAAAEDTERARTLHTLEYLNDKIYAGYGDYDVNTGPVEINPFDLNADAFTGSELQVPTEEINQIRTINGKLYAPTIDPLGGPIAMGGYAVGEPWELNMQLEGVHFYDMATLTGTDLWVAGAGPENAMVWRSTDNGTTWENAFTEESDTRFYWIANLNGKIYVQVNGHPVRIFDGTTWTDGTIQAINEENGKVIVFKDKIISTLNGMSSYDGTKVSKVNSFIGTSRNFYVDGDYLYVVRWDGSLARTNDMLGWQELEVPDHASSVAVHDGTVYIGTTDSKIYASTEPIPGVAPSVTMTAPSPGTVSGTINLAALATSSSAVTSVSFKIGGGITLQTFNSATYSYSWDTKGVLNGPYQLYVQIQNQDGSTATSDPVTVTVNNPKPTPTPKPTPIPSSQSKVKQTTVAKSTRIQIAATQSSATQSGGATSTVEPSAEQGDPEAVNPSAPAKATQDSEVKKIEKEAESNSKPIIFSGIAFVAATSGAIWFFAVRRRQP